MAVDRPTFSENWHRVAELKPKLRALVQVHRQFFRGQRWHVLRDPSNNRSFRLDDAGYWFVAMLDGRRTVADIWEACAEELGDSAPTQGEAIQLLAQLYTNNLIHVELPPDAESLFDRYKKRIQREVTGYVTNILFARIPIFDPDRILDELVKVFGWLFSVVGLVVWLIVIGFGAAHVIQHVDELWNQAAGVLAVNNLVWLYIAFAVIKLIHEMGHGVACKRFGQYEHNRGEVHTLGVMLLVLTPVPYVDASSAWVFRSKWRRAMVGAAGMYVELMVAAIAAIVWARTAEGQPINAIAYNMIFIASVSTLLFNANPLLRFDGYYILSDIVEIPNLNERAKRYLYYLIKRYAYGVRRPHNPAHSRYERVWFVVYGIASFIYRIFISVTIMLFIISSLPVIGLIMAVMAIAGWVVVPLGKWIKYLAVDAELMRTRQRAVVVTIAFFVVVLSPLAFVPFPDHGRAPGVVEADQFQIINASVAGKLTHAMTGPQRHVDEGATLVNLENPELLDRRALLQSTLAELSARYRQAREQREVATAQALADQIQSTRGQLKHVQRQIQRLTVRAPFAGTWVDSQLDKQQGAFLSRGTSLGVVATLDRMIIRATADQYLGPRLLSEMQGKTVEIRVDGEPGLQYTGKIRRILPAGSRQLPSAALAMSAGGKMMTSRDREDQQGGPRSQDPFFEVFVDVQTPEGQPPLLPGQRVIVRFDLVDRPLLEQAWIAGRQLLQRRLNL